MLFMLLFTTFVEMGSAQTVLMDPIDRALLIADQDTKSISSIINRDQAATDADAWCRIETNLAALDYIQEFKNDAPRIRNALREHKTIVDSLNQKMRTQWAKILDFQASVNIEEVQTKLESEGKIKLAKEWDGSVRINLKRVIQYLQLVSGRFGSCLKDPKLQKQKLDQWRRSLKSPLSNPWNFTENQIRFAAQQINLDLNAKLNSESISYQLVYPLSDSVIDSEICDSKITLKQTKRFSDRPKVEVYYSVQIDPKTDQPTLEALNNATVYRSFIHSLDWTEEHRSWDAYQRWIDTRFEISRACQSDPNTLDLNHFADSPYLSPEKFSNASEHFRRHLRVSAKTESLSLRSHNSIFLTPKRELVSWGPSMPIRGLDEKRIKRVSHGFNHSLIQLDDDSIWGWGRNSESQLCRVTETATTSPLPTEIQPILGIAGKTIRDFFAVGYLSLFLTHDGSVLFCGKNSGPILGIPDGTMTTPTAIPTLKNLDIAAVLGNSTYLLILLHDGTLWSMGNNTYLHRGVTDVTPALTKIRFPGDEFMRKFVTSAQFSFALSSSGRLFGWGINTDQAFVISKPPERPNPIEVIVQDQIRFRDVAIGFGFAIALKENGTVWSWGNSNHFGHGHHGKPKINPAVQIPILQQGRPVRTIDASGDISAIQFGRSEWWTTGDNREGQLGLGHSRPVTQFEQIQLPENQE